MGENTLISWSDATWPVARGCDKISPGCKLCWAIKDAHRMARNPNPKIAAHFEGLTQIEGGKPNWSGVVRLDEAILDWPLKWSKAKRIFVASSGDLFHESLEDKDIDRVFAVIHHSYSRGHTAQVLTKRTDRALRYLTNPLLYGRWMEAVGLVRGRWNKLPLVPLSDPLRFPLKHVQLGFSAETQPYFDARWNHMKELAKTGWMVWLSYEPALGPLDISAALKEGLSWVVCGGESGQGSRPMHPDWARAVRDQCVAANVPYHFKQWGEWSPSQRNHTDLGKVTGVRNGSLGPDRVHWLYSNGMHASVGSAKVSFPLPEYMVHRVGKKASGRTLDGREWSEFPGAPR